MTQLPPMTKLVPLYLALAVAVVLTPATRASTGADGYHGGNHRDDAGRAVPISLDPVPPSNRTADSVRIPFPRPEARLTGVTVIRASVSRGPRLVSFWIDGVLKGRDRSAPWKFNWHTTRYTDGRHVVRVQAVYDAHVKAKRVTYFVGNGSPAVLAAGDIGDCTTPGDEQTASILDSEAGTVLALGDVAYPHGSDADFASCFAPSWGRHKTRIRPVPGNHEYRTRDASGYFNYFGELAGDRGKGWYSFDVGGWHIIALNSNTAIRRGSPQLVWLQSDLVASRATCTLAYWHHPRFSSGPSGTVAHFEPWWELLYQHGVDVILNGHDHDYERFARQSPWGERDDARGIRQFVVGTGGGNLHQSRSTAKNSEARQAHSWGVLRLVLRDAGYSWRFLPVAGKKYADSGSDTCIR